MSGNNQNLAANDDGKSEASGTEICSNFQRSCSCCPTEMTGGGSCCAAIVEKLMAQLKASEMREKKLSERAKKAEDELEMLKKKLKNYESMDAVKEEDINQIFPSTSHSHYFIMLIASTEYPEYLYMDANGRVKFSNQPLPSVGCFKFVKQSDGCFAIFSTFLEKYVIMVKLNASEYMLRAAESGEDATKFALFFDKHPPVGKSETEKVMCTATIQALEWHGFVCRYRDWSGLLEWRIDNDMNRAAKFQFILAN